MSGAPSASPREFVGSGPRLLHTDVEGGASLSTLEQRRSRIGGDILTAGGLVLTSVAVAHIVLTWVPARFGVVPWEFAAATQTVDVFPLAVTGTALLAWTAVQRGWRARALALATWCVLLALFLLAVSGLIVLDLPVAWGSVAESMRESLLKTAGKALALSSLFTVFFGWLAVVLLRARRAEGALRR